MQARCGTSKEAQTVGIDEAELGEIGMDHDDAGC